MCATFPRRREYPNILGGHADISWRSFEQVESLLVQTAEKYVEECRAFMSALEDGDWSTDQVRSKVSFTVSDQRSDRTVALPNPAGVVHIATL